MKKTRLAVLTPDPADPTYGARITPPTAHYVALFERFGVEAFAHPWTEGPPRDAAGVLAGLVWGYHFRLDAFEALMRAWPASLPLINPPNVLLWNTRKTYLQALGAAGVSIIPTLTPKVCDAAFLQGAFDALDADELVVKPLVSAGSHQTFWVRRDDDLAEKLTGSPPHGRMIQPFLNAVAGEGELSAFFFDGVFSHAVRKQAADGDFRVQPQFGARLSAMQPTDDMLAVARSALAAAPDGLLYARIDMVRDAAGVLRLMELEAIEPDLYFEFAPDAGDAFGRAVLNRLGIG